jgi:hypothetical protein
MGSMGCRPWQRSVPVASRDWVASVDLWSFGLHLRFPASVEICGMLDLSGSVSLAHPNAEARCHVHVSRYRGIAHLSGGDYGKTTRSSHFTKDAVQKFWAPLIHDLTCFYMFLLTFSVIYIRAEVHHLSGPLPFSPALWHFWVYLSGASGKACLDQCGILAESDWSILIPPNQMLHERLNWIMQMDSEWCNIATFMLRPGHRPYI